MRTKRIIGWIGIALVIMSTGIATADTDSVVKWKGETSSDWYGVSNWVELAQLDPIEPEQWRPPTTNDVAHWDGNWDSSVQPILSGTNATMDELRVSAVDQAVVITVTNGTLNVTRNSGTGAPAGSSIWMSAATKDLTITGPGTFVQKGGADSKWSVVKSTVSGGNLIIDTAGLIIEPQVLTIDAKDRSDGSRTRTADIRSSCAATTASVYKKGNGRLILGGQNQWTGDTTIEDGTFIMATNNPLSLSSAVVFNHTSILEPSGFDADFSTLSINGKVQFNFDTNAASQIAFANSSSIVWTDDAAHGGNEVISLAINNFTEGVDSIRFGTDQFGLTVDQLNVITVNGASGYVLDSLGYLTSVNPEPQPIGMIESAISETGDSTELSWDTQFFQAYEIEYLNDLIYGTWTNYDTVIGNGTNMTYSIPIGVDDQAFYRIISE